MAYKIAMIGAGSVVFSRNLTGDLLQYPEFADATFSYMDVDADRLDVGAALCRKAADALGVKPTIEKTMDRAEAIRDADFVICMVQIGGFNSTLVDFEIPRKYGLNFTIADTTGPGGLFRALRTFPLMRDLARDIADVAKPGCWLLNYSNPMSMNMQALLRTSGDAATGRNGINAVGLCHSVQGTFAHRMRDIGLGESDAHFECVGINHMAFFTTLRGNDGRDLYPELFAVADEKIEKGQDAVRYELMKRLGYAITESSEHNAEYCAHFMPHRGLIERFKIPVDEYLRRCDGIVDTFDRLSAFARSDEPMPRDEIKKSHEYGSVIAHSIATGEASVVYGNMLNDGAIPNLPPTAIVETPTLVDANGCRLTRVSPVEPQLLAYMMPHVCQHELFFQAAFEGRRDKVYQAAISDPLTAATLPMDKIVEMCDELIAAHGMEGDGGVLPDLDRVRSLVPGSGKHFDPPTPAELRASWEKAKEKTSDEEAVEQWRVAGPIPRAAADDATAAVAESGPDAAGKLDWRDVAADADGRAVAAKASDAPAEATSVLAVATLASVHEREAPLRVSADGLVRLWVNGRDVPVRKSEPVVVPLAMGDNRLVLRVDLPPYQSGGEAHFGILVRKANF